MNDYIKRVIARLRMGWTKYAVAVDIKGNTVPSCSEDAVCWCLLGAMLRERELPVDMYVLDKMIQDRYKMSSPTINDLADNVDEVIGHLEGLLV